MKSRGDWQAPFSVSLRSQPMVPQTAQHSRREQNKLHLEMAGLVWNPEFIASLARLNVILIHQWPENHVCCFWWLWHKNVHAAHQTYKRSHWSSPAFFWQPWFGLGNVFFRCNEGEKMHRLLYLGQLSKDLVTYCIMLHSPVSTSIQWWYQHLVLPEPVYKVFQSCGPAMRNCSQIVWVWTHKSGVAVYIPYVSNSASHFSLKIFLSWQEYLPLLPAMQKPAHQYICMRP